MAGPVTYHIVYTDKKTFSLMFREDDSLTIFCPKNADNGDIDRFVNSRIRWIRSEMERRAARRPKPTPPVSPTKPKQPTPPTKPRSTQSASQAPLTEADIRALATQAKKDIPQRVRRWAGIIGVTYGRITIRHQKSRWGSCTGTGNLNFNCLLMLAPEEVRDYVVVHELCHRLEMNHSSRFWAHVARFMPDWSTRRQWLREHGGALIRRMLAGRDAHGSL